MLIVSKNKDYYDSIGEQFGIDKSIVYRREEITLNNSTGNHEIILMIHKALKDKGLETRLRLPFLNNTKFQMYTSWYLFGFCGNPYIGVKVTYKNATPGERHPMYWEDKTIFYYGEELLDILKSAAQEPIKRARYQNRNYNQYEEAIKQIETILSVDFSEVFFTRKTPAFLFSLTTNIHLNHELIINPILKNYQFFKVKTAPQAFQEIQQFISGVLGTDGNDIIVTDDKYKILAAGMDLKTSFRKDPGKPRPRKSRLYGK